MHLFPAFVTPEHCSREEDVRSVGLAGVEAARGRFGSTGVEEFSWVVEEGLVAVILEDADSGLAGRGSEGVSEDALFCSTAWRPNAICIVKEWAGGLGK